MRFYLNCYPCLLNMALNTAHEAGMNTSQTKTVIDKVMEFLIHKEPETTPPHIVARMYSFVQEELHETSNIFDPYKAIKEHTNNIALSYEKKLFEHVDKSSNRLKTALKVAAAGNIIDFGAKDHGSIDIDYEIAHIPDLSFTHYDYDKLIDHLRSAKLLLYIADNAGETVFDKVILLELSQQYPHLECVYAVRDRPVINDATIEDALTAKIDTVARVISSGSIYPGTIIEETSEEFQRLFRDADLIISKGQGNFETMMNVDNNRIFFILRVKCKSVARDLKTKIGSLVLWEKGCLPKETQG